MVSWGRAASVPDRKWGRALQLLGTLTQVTGCGAKTGSGQEQEERKQEVGRNRKWGKNQKWACALPNI